MKIHDHADKDPFRAYIGQRVLLRHGPAEIVRSEVRGRALLFFARCMDSECIIKLTVRDVLEHAIEENP